MPLVDFVALWVKKHVLSANLMDLLPCATEKVQMHLRATRLVEPPIPEIFIIGSSLTYVGKASSSLPAIR